ncbi:MAG: flagellar hook protein FlgE [Acetobacterium sp.]
MLIAMYSGISGMSAHQTKLNVIGNNIANVNTYGFKSSRVTFSDVFYQTLQNPAAPEDNSGGINANQLGYGSKVATIDVINTMAGGADTGRALDVYINGDGYLPVKGNDGMVKYTRVGNLRFDSAGNLTDTNGNFVLGIPMDDNGVPQLDDNGTTDVSKLQSIQIPSDQLEKYTGIAIGPSGEITGIREGDPVFTPSPYSEWLGSMAIDPASNYSGSVTMSAVADPAGTGGKLINASVYTKGGSVVEFKDVAWNGTDTEIILGDMTLTVDPTEFGALADMTGANIGKIGIGNGVPVTLAYISLAKFSNPDGLLQDGNGYFLQSVNSGTANATKAGTKGTGNLRSSALEMSNVDLSKEFTDMIIAQRGFQANTRMITVSDTILEELINLKR